MWLIKFYFIFLLPIAFLPNQEKDSTVVNKEEVCLSDQEKELYALIMEYRKAKKMNKIPYSSKLTQVAQAHVKDLALHYDFSQNAKCNPHSWSDNGEWSSCCYTDDHKQAQCMWDKPREIANYEGDGYEIAYYHSAGAKALNALEGWKKSKGHNPLLINLGMWKEIEWKGIGVGIYENYAVVWFGRENDASEIIRCN